MGDGMQQTIATGPGCLLTKLPHHYIGSNIDQANIIGYMQMSSWSY